MRKLIILAIAIILTARCIHAQYTAVPFLMVPPDARSGGIGEAGVALTDNAWASYWNPAGYAFQQGSEIAVSDAKWFPSNGTSNWIGHIAVNQHVDALGGVASAMVTYLNMKEFGSTLNSPDYLSTYQGHEMAITVGYATKVVSTLGLGVNARYFYYKLTPFGTANERFAYHTPSGISFDIGLLYKPESVVIPFTGIDLGNNLRLGMNISNIGKNIIYIDQVQKESLPMNLRLGFACDFIHDDKNSLTWIMDANRLLIYRDTDGVANEFYKALYTTWTGSTINEQIREFTLNTGLEYWYGSPKLIALRIGYFYEDPGYNNRRYITLGGGIRYNIFGFDFSYFSTPSSDEYPLDEKMRFSLSIGW